MIALVLMTLAQAPTPITADAPVVDSPVVMMVVGEPAPYEGYLVSKPETLRRGKKLVECETTLETAQANVLLPKGAVVALIGVAAAAVISSVSLGIALAMKK